MDWLWRQRIVISILFLWSLKYGITAPPSGADFAFIVRDWSFPNAPLIKVKSLNRGDSLIISCQTNDPAAVVSLLRSESSLSTGYLNAKEYFVDRMVPVGQNFSVTVQGIRDSGFYKCDATSLGKSISLNLGRMLVGNTPRDVTPELSPSFSKILIEDGGSKIIKCEAQGAAGKETSYLSWYKLDSSGVKQSIDQSRAATVRDGEVVQDKHFDIEYLNFNRFQAQDEGTYVCERAPPATLGTVTSVSVVLEIETPAAPNVTIQTFLDYGYEPKPNQYFRIDCIVQGSPRPERGWYHNGNPISLNETCTKLDNNCIFYRESPQLSDTNGTFTCRAVNTIGSDEQSVELILQIPPKIKSTSEIRSAGFNESLELYCTLESGNPNPTHRWYWQAWACASVSSCPPDPEGWKPYTQQFPSVSTPTNESLIVVSPTKTSYHYSCQVSSSAGSHVYNFTLRRVENPPPQFEILPKGNQLVVSEEEALELRCDTDVNVFDAAVMWMKDSSPLPVLTNISESTRILVYRINRVSAADSGVYSCVAKFVRGGQVKRLSTQVRVLPLSAPFITDFDDITIQQQSVQYLKVFCNVSGNPAPIVTWTLRDAAIQFESRISTPEACNQTLPGRYLLNDDPYSFVICRPEYKSDMGQYGCYAENRLGKMRKSLALTINARPVITEPKRPQEVRNAGLNGFADLECAADGNPPPNITWYRIKENSSSSRIQSDYNLSILKLVDLTPSEAGSYICVASNVFGEASARLSLVLTGRASTGSGKVPGSAIGGIIVGIIIFLLLCVLFLVWYQRKLKKKYALYLAPNPNFQLDPDRTLFEQSSDLPYDVDWEFPRERLVFIKTLGSGAFGQVWLAEAEGINALAPRDKSSGARKRRKTLGKSMRYQRFPRKKQPLIPASDSTLEKIMVAVKTLKDDGAESEYKDLASELKILIYLGEHKNIVNLLGACTRNGKLCVILEFCPHGSLLTFLRGKRDVFRPLWQKHEASMENEFTLIDLILIAYQVAKGMEFLESKKCVHRDLAARNILVGADFMMKIADFGLARDIYKDEFYLKQTTGLLPVKWMAPESLFDKMYTSQSDAWSYGILLWEVFTLGGSPYPGLPTEDLFAFLEDGRRMDCPDICPQEVYELMSDCWQRTPYERPLFSQVVDRINKLLKSRVPGDNTYLDMVDGDTNYLHPTSPTRKAPLEDDGYLAVASNGQSKQPQGRTYVTSPRSPEAYSNMSDAPLPPIPLQEGRRKSRDPMPARYSDGYTPMTPAAHGKPHYDVPGYDYDHDGEEAVV